MTLSAEQRETVTALVAAHATEPAARDWTSVGCVALVLAAAGAGLLPTVARFAGPRLRVGLFVALGLLALAGLALWLLGRTIGLAPIHRRVEQAVGRLTLPGTSENDRLHAAVTLLLDAHHAPGPYTAVTYDAAAMAARLGDALPLVIAVEAALLGEGRIYPVFTAPPPGSAPA